MGALRLRDVINMEGILSSFGNAQIVNKRVLPAQVCVVARNGQTNFPHRLCICGIERRWERRDLFRTEPQEGKMEALGFGDVLNMERTELQEGAKQLEDGSVVTCNVMNMGAS